MIAHHGLGNPRLVAYHDTAPKPSPAPIVMAPTLLCLPPEVVIGVGDGESDLLAYQVLPAPAVFRRCPAWTGI